MAELTGKIIAVLPLASGVSSRTGKEWASQEYVIEEQDARFPQKICFRVFGIDKIQSFALQLGEVVTAKFELSCREYNGKWYNEINCWGIDRPQAVLPNAQEAVQGQTQGQDLTQQPVYHIQQPQQQCQQQPQNYSLAGNWQQPAPMPQQSNVRQQTAQAQQYQQPTNDDNLPF